MYCDEILHIGLYGIKECDVIEKNSCLSPHPPTQGEKGGGGEFFKNSFNELILMKSHTYIRLSGLFTNTENFLSPNTPPPSGGGGLPEKGKIVLFIYLDN